MKVLLSVELTTEVIAVLRVDKVQVGEVAQSLVAEEVEGIDAGVHHEEFLDLGEHPGLVVRTVPVHARIVERDVEAEGRSIRELARRIVFARVVVHGELTVGDDVLDGPRPADHQFRPLRLLDLAFPGVELLVHSCVVDAIIDPGLVPVKRYVLVCDSETLLYTSHFQILNETYDIF